MSNKELNKERNRLNRILRNKKQELEKLEKTIEDEKLRLDSLKSDTTKCNQLISQKEELQSEVSELENKKIDFTGELKNLKQKETTIFDYLKDNSPKKSSLEEEIKSLNENKARINDEIENLNQKQSELNGNIDQLTSEKTRLEDTTKELREKFNLYSKDMRDMSLDSTSQLKNYTIYAVITFSIAIALMVILICLVTYGSPYKEELLNFFKNEPTLRFFTLLTIRISVSAIFIFFIIIFLNMGRGFISQYIKARNRLTALRVADFLIGRIKSKANLEVSEDEKSKLETERIREQVNLLNVHIPKIMDLGKSSFDKNDKTELSVKDFKKMILKDKSDE